MGNQHQKHLPALMIQRSIRQVCMQQQTAPLSWQIQAAVQRVPPSLQSGSDGERRALGVKAVPPRSRTMVRVPTSDQAAALTGGPLPSS